MSAERELASAYETITKNLEKAETIYSNLLDSISFEWGKFYKLAIELVLDKVRIMELSGKDRQVNMELITMWDGVWKESLCCPPDSHAFPINKDVVKLLHRRVDKIYTKTNRMSFRQKLSDQFEVMMRKHLEAVSPQISFTIAQMFDEEGKIVNAISYYEKYLNLYRGSLEKIPSTTALTAAIRLSEIYQAQDDLGLAQETALFALSLARSIRSSRASGVVVQLSTRYVTKESPRRPFEAYDMLLSALEVMGENEAFRPETIHLMSLAASASNRVDDLRQT